MSKSGFPDLRTCILALVGLLAGTVLAACGSGEAAEPGSDPRYGPMAVVDAGAGRNEASTGKGELRIDDRCVTFESDRGGQLLLVWREGDVTWSEQDQSITFTGPIHGREIDSVAVEDGDVLSVGGSGVIVDEEAAHPPVTDAWVDEQDWIVNPDGGCTTDPYEPWLVGSLNVDPPAE